MRPGTFDGVGYLSIKEGWMELEVANIAANWVQEYA